MNNFDSVQYLFGKAADVRYDIIMPSYIRVTVTVYDNVALVEHIVQIRHKYMPNVEITRHKINPYRAQRFEVIVYR